MQDAVRTYNDGPVSLEGIPLLMPGEEAGALLQPLHPEYWRHVRAGMRIEAYEGSRLIGVAIVEEVG